MKVICDKPTANITLNGERLKAFPSASGTRVLTPTSLIQHCTKNPSYSNQIREINIHIGKEEVKLSSAFICEWYGFTSEGGHGNPLQYSCFENPTGRGAWQATVYRVAKSWTWLRWLSVVLYGEKFKDNQKPVRTDQWIQKSYRILKKVKKSVAFYILAMKYKKWNKENNNICNNNKINKIVRNTFNQDDLYIENAKALMKETVDMNNRYPMFMKQKNEYC